MRLLTNDSLFGLVVTPTRTPRFFSFQLVLNGVTIGDDEPSIVWSGVNTLRSLQELGADGLDPLVFGPAEILRVLSSTEHLDVSSLLTLTESLDEWSIRGYRWRTKAVLIACESSPVGSARRALMAVPEYHEYELILDQAGHVVSR